MNESTPDVVSPDLSAPPDAPLSSPVDPDSGSLADHEAAHGSAVAEPEPEPETRDEGGRFKPRHRAKSQQSDADDVPVINELTKRLKAAEEAAGKDIARKDGESERVYTLRRRAEIAERLATPAPKPQAPQPPAVQPQRRAQQPIPATFPSYEAFIAIEGNEAVDYDTYRDIRDDWGYQRRRAQEQHQEAEARVAWTAQERAAAHLARVPAARQKYHDFDAVVNAPDLPQLSFVLRDAILASSQSEEVQYYLGKHRAELAALVAESQDYSPSAVAAMRRYLDTLVAPQRSSPPMRPAAGSTGAALTLAPPPAPKPPTPVRTGTVTSADDPPGDDASLAAHEKFYGRARR